MDFNISSGKVHTAVKTVIYGAEGIGKTTLAAQFPNPLFIDTEGSTKQLDVARLPAPTSWEMLMQELDFVIVRRPCSTLVIDTVDWAEQLCIADLCARNAKNGIEDFGYGKGWEYEKESFGKFLNKLTEVINAGINVTLTAHAALRKFEQPDEMGSYDRWEMKLGSKTTNKISPLIKEWADIVLFCNYKTLVVQTDKEGKKHKAQGNRRVMYTQHHPCWDAKNRYGLPEEIPMEYAQIAHIYAPVQPLETPPAPAASTSATDIQPGIPQSLADLMAASGITEQQIRAAVAMKGYFPEDMPISAYPEDFVSGVLVGAWKQIVDFINEQKYPF
jgi:hypothetical protein|nr:MAG TPA: AAA domain protein [Bacteriophage sp.]